MARDFQRRLLGKDCAQAPLFFTIASYTPHLHSIRLTRFSNRLPNNLNYDGELPVLSNRFLERRFQNVFKLACSCQLIEKRYKKISSLLTRREKFEGNELASGN